MDLARAEQSHIAARSKVVAAMQAALLAKAAPALWAKQPAPLASAQPDARAERLPLAESPWLARWLDPPRRSAVTPAASARRMPEED